MSNGRVAYLNFREMCQAPKTYNPQEADRNFQGSLKHGPPIDVKFVNGRLELVYDERKAA
jgi:hypothetical protein